MRTTIAILFLLVAGASAPGTHAPATLDPAESAHAALLAPNAPATLDSAEPAHAAMPEPTEAALLDSDATNALDPAEPAEATYQSAPPGRDDHGFRFVRVRYESTSGGWGRRQSWATDYPAAERHLQEAIERTTGLYVEGMPIALELTDERIFEYPVLYLTEPGFWRTNDEEVAMLKKYLDRGGFLIIDDFHDYGRGRVGPQWNNMYDNIKRVFPDREPVELTAEHPIWSVYYDIDPDAAVSTKTGGRAGNMPFGPLDDIYYGIFDDDGRMVVAICYNQDIGDGWEHPTVNLADMSTISFQMGINIILYALTH